MSFESKQDFIREMFIDKIINGTYYSDENINSLLDEYFRLKLKIESQDELMKHVNDQEENSKNELKRNTDIDDLYNKINWNYDCSEEDLSDFKIEEESQQHSKEIVKQNLDLYFKKSIDENKSNKNLTKLINKMYEQIKKKSNIQNSINSILNFLEKIKDIQNVNKLNKKKLKTELEYILKEYQRAKDEFSKNYDNQFKDLLQFLELIQEGGANIVEIDSSEFFEDKNSLNVQNKENDLQSIQNKFKTFLEKCKDILNEYYLNLKQ